MAPDSRGARSHYIRTHTSSLPYRAANEATVSSIFGENMAPSTVSRHVDRQDDCFACGEHAVDPGPAPLKGL